MKLESGLLLAGAAQTLAAAFPGTTYGDKLKPYVKSKPYQDAITTEGYLS